MKYIPTNKWVYSRDDEFFSSEEFETKVGAIEACRDDYGEGYVGQVVHLEFEEFDMPSSDLEENLAVTLYDEIGDASECWELPVADENAIDKMIAKVMIDYINEHHLQPSCFKVVDIEEVTPSGNR